MKVFITYHKLALGYFVLDNSIQILVKYKILYIYFSILLSLCHHHR